MTVFFLSIRKGSGENRAVSGNQETVAARRARELSPAGTHDAAEGRDRGHPGATARISQGAARRVRDRRARHVPAMHPARNASTSVRSDTRRKAQQPRALARACADKSKSGRSARRWSRGKLRKMPPPDPATPRPARQGFWPRPCGRLHRAADGQAFGLAGWEGGGVVRAVASFRHAWMKRCSASAKSIRRSAGRAVRIRSSPAGTSA
jgi:hypothetical protein